jgi:DNA-directed RNA polymerase subunit F
MKKILLFIAIAGFATIAKAQPPAGDANPGDWYGEKVNPAGAVALSEVAQKLGDNDAVDTKIRAKIIEVCPKKGCWLKLQVNDSTTALVKMKDYGFFLPLAAKGKTVVLDGEVKMKNTSVEELKHYAEDAKKSKEEIAAITKPEKEIRVTAKGIVVVE